MAEESDGIGEEFDTLLRVGLIVAGRAAEAAARMREQAARNARAASEQQARDYAARLHAQRAAARAHLTVVDQDQWWDTATAQDVAGMWETARAWQGLDPTAARAADRIRVQIRDRYGLDVDTLSADPGGVRDALARRGIAEEQASEQRRQATREETEAALLLDEADRADRGRQADLGDELEAGSGQVYDSAQRRENLAADLDGVADSEAVHARVGSDTYQARPASEAVTHAPGRAPRARKGRWNPWDRGQQPTRTVGR